MAKDLLRKFLGADTSKVKDGPRPVNSDSDKWIEVEGYKGVHSDMTAANDFKYEVGKTCSMNEDDVKECEKGFHFCLNPKDVYTYYPPNFDTRYFKVRGLVRQSDFDSYGSVYPFYLGYSSNKLVAKEITLLEEVPLAEMDGAMEKLENDYPYIKLMDTTPKTLGEYKIKVKEICDRDLSSYSQTFRFFMLGSDFPYDIYAKMKFLQDEGVSLDMRAYILTALRIDSKRGNSDLLWRNISL
jgi:hypothetical protein